MSASTEGNGHRDPGALLGRQAGAALRALLRPATYVGAAMEAWNALLHTAMYAAGTSPVEAWQASLGADRAAPTVHQRPDASTATTPVVLVHGYVMNRAAFRAMRHALLSAGFRHVRVFGYPQFTLGLEAIATRLAVEVERIRVDTGARRCVLVGHSMGGVVARTYVELLGGADAVDTVVTLGTPHSGTCTAAFGVGPAAAEMAYRSPFLQRLEAPASPAVRRVRYLSYYSDLDTWVVPAVSAKLEHPTIRATNIMVRDVGHLSLLVSGEVIGSVVGYLAHPERARPRAPGAVAGPGPRPTDAARREPPGGR